MRPPQVHANRSRMAITHSGVQLRSEVTKVEVSSMAGK
jgi:hypothetical protein